MFSFLVGLIYLMFNDHLSAHSPLLLAKTGLMRMIDEDEVDLKEQPEDAR